MVAPSKAPMSWPPARFTATRWVIGVMSRSSMPQTSFWSASTARASSIPSTSRMTMVAANSVVPRAHERRQQRGAPRQGREPDVLVPGVGAVPLDAEAVEGRDAERRGQVAVAAAAAGALAELEAELGGDRACLRVERQHGRRAP